MHFIKFYKELNKGSLYYLFAHLLHMFEQLYILLGCTFIQLNKGSFCYSFAHLLHMFEQLYIFTRVYLYSIE